MTGESASSAEQPPGRPMPAYGEVGRRGRQEALQRLRSARGHLDAVVRMLESDRYCVDVLQQLAAVEGALAGARREVLEAHVRGCVVDAMHEGAVEDAAREALAAVFGDRPPTTGAAARAIP